MTIDEIAESSSILARMLRALYGTLESATGQAAANLYFALGDLSANADALFQAARIGLSIANVFDLAVDAGASLGTMEKVRVAMQAETPAFVSGVCVASAGVQLALAAEVKILAATAFTSRQDVDAALSVINEAFEAAEEYAADHRNPSVYQALIGAHAAAVRDLTTRARPLPDIITYQVPRVMTSHALANRLYGDASRADEIAAENKTIDPAFMALSGTALSQ